MHLQNVAVGIDIQKLIREHLEEKIAHELFIKIENEITNINGLQVNDVLKVATLVNNFLRNKIGINKRKTLVRSIKILKLSSELADIQDRSSVERTGRREVALLIEIGETQCSLLRPILTRFDKGKAHLLEAKRLIAVC